MATALCHRYFVGEAMAMFCWLTTPAWVDTETYNFPSQSDERSQLDCTFGWPQMLPAACLCRTGNRCAQPQRCHCIHYISTLPACPNFCLPAQTLARS